MRPRQSVQCHKGNSSAEVNSIPKDAQAPVPFIQSANVTQDSAMVSRSQPDEDGNTKLTCAKGIVSADVHLRLTISVLISRHGETSCNILYERKKFQFQLGHGRSLQVLRMHTVILN